MPPPPQTARLPKEEKKAIKAQTTRRKKGVLAGILVVNFLVLGYFKYWSHFAALLSGAWAASTPSALGLVHAAGY